MKMNKNTVVAEVEIKICQQCPHHASMTPPHPGCCNHPSMPKTSGGWPEKDVPKDHIPDFCPLKKNTDIPKKEINSDEIVKQVIQGIQKHGGNPKDEDDFKMWVNFVLGELEVEGIDATRHIGSRVVIDMVRANWLNVSSGREIADRFAEKANPNGNPSFTFGFLDSLIKEHRTEQANVIRAMIEILNAYGKKAREEKLFDDRNEEAVKACEKITELDIKIPYV